MDARVAPGVPLSPYIHEWVDAHARASPTAPAILTPTVEVSYADLAERTRRLASHLRAGGTGAGDRILVALPNTIATVVAALAAQTIGAVPVEVDRTWSADALAGIVERTKVRTAVIWVRDAEKWGVVLDRRPVDALWVVHPHPVTDLRRTTFGRSVAQVLLEDGQVESNDVEVRLTDTPARHPDMPALILYTSGSTGAPTGVIQTYRNIDANARSIISYLRLTREDRALLTLPLHYCYGRSVLQTHLRVGGSILLDNRFAFPRTVLTTFASHGCTGLAGVPLTFEIIRRQVDVASMSFPRLRYLTQAGGPMSPETIGWVRQAFSPAQLFVMYGQTEATARLSYLPPEMAETKPGSIGIPIDGVELRVVGPDGSELPVDEVGDLVARGENITPGYFDDPVATMAILRDGWLWTGDLASRDQDGYLYHHGRAKEILKVGGHRVSPLEIERVLASHPGVAEVAVGGVPDDLMGEVPVAFVIRAPGAADSDDDLRQWCLERLPGYAVPTRFFRVESIPRSAAGKIQRAALVRSLSA